jgi:hypothetical protein
MLGKKVPHYSIFVNSFLNHDYTEEDEFKVSLFHLIHFLQCNHGSENENEQFGTHMLIV